MTFLNNNTESTAWRPRRTCGARRCCAWVAAALLLLSGCDMLDMYDQPKYRTFEACDFFADGSSARPVVP